MGTPYPRFELKLGEQMSQEFPQYAVSAPNQPAQKPPNRRRGWLIVAGLVVAFFVVIAIGSAATDGVETQATGTTKLPNVVSTKTTVPPTTTKPAAPATTKAAEPEVAKPSMTKSQEQAVGSAQSYLSFSSFSRKGLIRQLSSSAGEGFSVADATFAVDHLKIDWNEQAAKSAKRYLEMTHFSRKGLIRQLESSAGEGFTHAQAVYGVNKAGL